MYRWLPLLLAGCSFQLGPGAAIDDAARDDARLIDARLIDAPATDGPLIDGPLIDGPLIDGPLIDGPLIDGPLIDGPSMIDAPMIDAPMIDAPMTAFCDATDATLRACYRFEGNLSDGSMYANGGGGGASYTNVNAHIGSSLNAAASTVTVPIATSLKLSQFTIKLWIRPTTVPTSAVARMGLLDNDQLRLFVQMGGKIRCAINDGSADVITTTTVAINTWTRIACTYGTAGIKVYFNGAEQGSFNTAVALVPLMTGTTIGRQEPSGDTFNGLIDDVQIFSTVVAP